MHAFDEEARKALKDRLPFRVFLDPLAQDFAADYLRSAQQFVHGQIRDIFQSESPGPNSLLLQLLAVEIWGRRIFIVLDVNHDTYDWDTAHNTLENNLPVFRFKLHKDKKRGNITRDKALDRRVNNRIAELHRLNGLDVRPPYLADHSPGADPIQYRAPRNT
ncbi:uncharacterized protein BP5553_09748 [Venustampulla echinocandica]|uniref:Uncharacterized protein n=1 Tax=Venustampulla echinocandica TaxID=2656787 RepID=A0A370TBW4_9HELO|nr:uncharacterized protein BP5553_09748 [Venustampulla echinocandica]RDL31539.1 hypothetical protein BP5553_09748 [Venustampulla echinocandica]